MAQGIEQLVWALKGNDLLGIVRDKPHRHTSPIRRIIGLGARNHEVTATAFLHDVISPNGLPSVKIVYDKIVKPNPLLGPTWIRRAWHRRKAKETIQG